MQRGAHETAAIVLLLIGGFFAGVGWLAGVILLWLSDVWTTRDKLIGTLFVPGGLALPLLLLVRGATYSSATSCFADAAGATTCTSSGGPSTLTAILWGVALVFCVVAPIAAAVHLARTGKRPLQVASYG